MKTKNLLKLALMMVAMFAFVGVFAQDPADFDDAALDTDISYVTIGKTMPFFVVPDATYHPTWTAFSNNLTAGFTWTWTSAAFGTELTLATQTDNYVTITANTLGDYPVNVVENPPAAWGTCTDAGTDVTIRVVEAPELVSFPFFDGLPLASGGTLQECAPYGPFDVDIELSGFPNYEVKFTLTQQALDIDGTPTGPVNTLVTDATVGAGNVLVREANQTYDVDAARTLDLIAAGTRTQYVYTFTGITDNVSRKSDYLSGETLYGAAATYTIIVNPTPTTGPIFHIPNDFGNI